MKIINNYDMYWLFEYHNQIKKLGNSTDDVLMKEYTYEQWLQHLKNLASVHLISTNKKYVLVEVDE